MQRITDVVRHEVSTLGSRKTKKGHYISIGI